MKVLFCVLFAAILAGAFSQTIYSNADLSSGSSPGGTSCGHSNSYDFTGNSRGSFYVGFPTAGLSGPVSSALFYYKPTLCVNTDKLSFSVRTIKNAAATFNETGGINNQCPFLDAQDTFEAVFDSTCTSQGIDITTALNAALAVGNSQFVLSLFDATKYDPNATNPNFCNRFVTPNVEPHFNDQSNCGVHVQSGQSFYLIISSSSSTTAAPSTAAPTTSAPSTAAPTTSAPSTAAPTTSTAAPVSPSCSSANVSGPNVASPARRLRQASQCSGNGVCSGQSCVCNAGFSGLDCETATTTTTAPSTAAPTTTSAPTENTSGDNNARATSSATKVASVAGLMGVAAAALAL